MLILCSLPCVQVTVVFTVERYLAVCHPIHGKVWCTVHRAKLASLAATLIVFINTLPTLFELEVVVEAAAAATTTDGTTGGNVTSIVRGSGGGGGGGGDGIMNAAYESLQPAYATTTSRLGARSEAYLAGVDFTRGMGQNMNFSEILTAAFTTPSLGVVPSISGAMGLDGEDTWANVRDPEGQGRGGANEDVKVAEGDTQTSVGRPRCVETSLARRPSYMIGYSWWYVTVFAFVPLIFLAIFNTVLIRALIVAGRKRQQLALISTTTTTTCAGGNNTPRNSAFLRTECKLTKKEQKLARQEMTKLASNGRDTNNSMMFDGLSTSQNSHGSFHETASHSSLATTLTHKRQTRRISREQNKVTLLLVTIVMIFFVCQLPWTALYLYKVLGPEPSPAGIIRLKIAGNVCNLLALVNASVNFYLYSCFSKRFRRTLAKLLFCWRRRRNMSPTTV